MSNCVAKNKSIKFKEKTDIGLRVNNSMTNFQEKTARNWYKRYENDEGLKRRAGGGRRKILNAVQEEDILNRIQENPFLTARSFAREYGVDDKTISSIFLRNGLSCHTAARETRLTEDHRINRVAYCRVMLEKWDEDRLNTIIFSDEKNFSTDVSWRCKVYRPYNTRYEPHYVQEIQRSGRITNNYWGAIGIDGPVTDIVQIDGKFNSQQYMRIIRNHVIPMMSRFEANNEPRTFMQDNSPVHTASNTMALLARQNFEVLAWPPLSPELNPIENVWSYMEKDWPRIYPRNAQTLDVVVQQRWNDLLTNAVYFQNLYRSLRNRFQEVVDCDGHWCRY